MKGIPRLLAFFLALSLVSAAAAKAGATQPVGVYAIIDRVILEPEKGPAERVQLWGAFKVANIAEKGRYEPPARGYLYFRAAPGKEDVARKEWADLRRLAGTGKVAAFGNRVEQKVRLRRIGEAPKDPDVYTTSIGVVELDPASGYRPIVDLVKLPGPLTPAAGEKVKAGKVTLRFKEAVEPGRPHARFRFEIESSAGEKDASGDIEPKDGEASWTPKLEVKAGAAYTWRVGAVDGKWKGEARTAKLVGVAR